MGNRRFVAPLIFTLVCLAVFWTAMRSGSMRSPGQATPLNGQTDKLREVPQMIRNSKSAGAEFKRQELFQSDTKPAAEDAQLRGALDGGAVVDVNKSAMQRILNENVEFLNLPLPDGKGGSVELELVKVNIFSPGFKVNTSKPTKERTDEGLGAHYRGIVKGNEHSLAAISIFQNEVMGFYSTEAEGNNVVGRLSGNNPTDRHVVYAEKDLKARPDFHCDTEDPKEALPQSLLQEPEQALVKCVRMFLEANYDLYLNKGSSVTNVTNYLTGMFNQSGTLYANDGVPVAISEFFVWNTPSPYTGANSAEVLNQFAANRGSFNGDIAHLLSLQNYGGRAYINILCNRPFSYGFSGIFASFSNVPTYSWTVEVFTHETGHNLGSPHTHACQWNGNNTAIDSCGPFAGYPYEGNCSNAPLPASGTIMSYCHLVDGVGINLANGFSLQPRNLILTRVNTASINCLQECGGGPTIRPVSDFDGDNKSDIAVFRPSNGTWYLSQSQAGFAAVNFGLNGDLAVPGDYDGDAKTDVAVFRPSNGTWYIQRSQLGFTVYNFGLNGDIPVTGDYDGDLKADIGVFRPSNGTWYIQRSQLGFTAYNFGLNGDIPAVGDYDGDGKADFAVFRPSNGTWYIQRSLLGFLVYGFGTNGDKPTPGDYDGDTKTDIAVFRPSNGTWYLQRSQLGFTGVNFGLNGDMPAPGDYDGDIKTDIAVFRPSNGTWYLQRSQLGFYGQPFGLNGDTPVAGAYIP